jgi:hypothetical protein
LIGDIRFKPESQTFEKSITVGIRTVLDGDLTLRCTTDGTVPSASSPECGEEMTITETTELRVQAFEGDTPAGEMGTALYIQRTFDFNSNLPLVILEGYGLGKPEDKEVFKDLAFMAFEPGEDGRSKLSNIPDVATRAGWHLRGQSSASFEKAPYRVELWGNVDDDEADYELAGMEADGDWAFIGPFSDRSLLRNAFTYQIGAEMGLETVDVAFAEVYINYDGGPVAETDYQGVYMIAETIKNKKGRLNLKQLDETDTDPDVLSGGYIMKFDYLALDTSAGEVPLECVGSEPFGGGGGFGGWGVPQDTDAEEGTCFSDLELVDPSPVIPAQQDWITDYVQTLHDALHQESFSAFAEYVDIDSFVDHFIINELTMDVDSYARSSYFHKDRNEPLKAGPLWDYNFALGFSMNFGGGGWGGVVDEDTDTELDTSGWAVWKYETGHRGATDWWRILGIDSEFRALVKARWDSLRSSTLSQAHMEQVLDEWAAKVGAEAAARDWAIWPVDSVSWAVSDEPTWEGQIEYIKTYLTYRCAWLDQNL